MPIGRRRPAEIDAQAWPDLFDPLFVDFAGLHSEGKDGIRLLLPSQREELRECPGPPGSGRPGWLRRALFLLRVLEKGNS